MAATWIVPATFHGASSDLFGLVKNGFADFAEPSRRTALRFLAQGLHTAAVAVAPVAVMAAVAVVLANVSQGRPSLAWAKLKPDPSRLSPITGAKRMFSSSGIMNMAKQAAKLTAIALISAVVLAGAVGVAAVGGIVPLGALTGLVAGTIIKLSRYAALAGFAVGVADWAWQRRQIMESLKMSRQEAKEEMRRDQGSPEARSARRRAALRLYRARMTGNVRNADVLVVNPTHYAVGLSYRHGVDKAPRVVARGTDQSAVRLRSEAWLAGIPIMEDPPLAQAVHRACLVGDVVPIELYEAVAKLFAWLYKTRRSAIMYR